ncbi:hypothetical protein AXI59_14570 [Bacillus nakamurai]|nr:hypothetical protein AXI59_14570 [Bacillus nakamurai]
MSISENVFFIALPLFKVFHVQRRTILIVNEMNGEINRTGFLFIFAYIHIESAVYISEFHLPCETRITIVRL